VVSFWPLGNNNVVSLKQHLLPHHHHHQQSVADAMAEYAKKSPPQFIVALGDNFYEGTLVGEGAVVVGSGN